MAPRRRRVPVLGTIVVLLALALVTLTVSGFKFMVIRSGSMEPTFQVGQLILDKPVPATALQPGQIVSFHDAAIGNQIVTHRIMRITRHGDQVAVVTKGDANRITERWTVSADSKLGVVVASTPYAGRVLADLGHMRIIILIMTGLALYLFVGILKWIWKKPT